MSNLIPDVSARPNDILVLLLGGTGCGKSTFINSVLGRKEAEESSTMNSETSKVRGYSSPLPPESACQQHRYSRLVLIDTPGFDNSFEVDDQSIFENIRDWLALRYGKHPLAGIIYMHDISDQRVRNRALNFFRLMEEFHSTQPKSTVVLVTTYWEQVNFEIAHSRHEQLRNYFLYKVLSATPQGAPNKDPIILKNPAPFYSKNSVCQAIDSILQANDPILQANDPIFQANDPIFQANDPILQANDPRRRPLTSAEDRLLSTKPLVLLV
ncbi:hypothetical protein FA15DRAFT_61460 [Coprinopsis marcescibilis]|uniref:AIG1-type G domain-containing protein n=1 Tax=Coprinopsis marcescibilis TaxID=230819 RepID=A0A5C3L5Z0_COPMA|nr:hypothetical protein FA15DRAFT_61460 [Coprinopsis marcescibilis]